PSLYTSTVVCCLAAHVGRGVQKPPPVVVAVCVIGDAPAKSGVRVNITGVASMVLPVRPGGKLSGTSVIAAQRLIGPAVPLGEFTLTTTGLEADGVTMASSFVTVSVEFPTLPRKPGFEPVKTALTG